MKYDDLPVNIEYPPVSSRCHVAKAGRGHVLILIGNQIFHKESLGKLILELIELYKSMR